MVMHKSYRGKGKGMNLKGIIWKILLSNPLYNWSAMFNHDSLTNILKIYHILWE